MRRGYRLTRDASHAPPAPGTSGFPTSRAHPNPEHLLVFYLPDETDWRAAIERLRAQGHEPVPSNNPYWERRGKTFEDPDGYRVVLQNTGW